MKASLLDISNLHIKKGGRRNYNLFLREFLALMVSEYVLDTLKCNVQDTLYCDIRSLLNGEKSAVGLLEEFRAYNDPSIDDFLSILPTGNDTELLNTFIENFTWTNDMNANTFCVGGKFFTIPQKLLALNCNDAGQYIVLKFVPLVGGFCGLGEKPTLESVVFTAESPLIDSVVNLQLSESEAFTISETEFFESYDDLKAADTDQRKAITCGTGQNLVILAGAGSGKTRTLTCRLAYLHLVKGIPLEQIILLTFTKNAASEMKHRSQRIIKAIYAHTNHRSDSEVQAKTIDSFIYAYIKNNPEIFGFKSEPTFYMEDDPETRQAKYRMLLEVIKENHWEEMFYEYMNGSHFGENVKYLMSDLENFARGLTITHAGIEALLSAYLEKQIEANVIMGFVYANLLFRDKLQEVNSAAKTLILNSYRCILIDEFQDIDSLQNSTFEPFYDSEIHFTFVGDDDQSIYGWRGSDSSIIRNLTERPGVKTQYLLTNYRNNPNIVAAGNCVLRYVKDRAKTNMPIRASKPTGAPIRISTYDQKCTNIANEIERLISSGTPTEKICVLTRDSSGTAMIGKALTNAGIQISKEKIHIDVDDNYKLMKAIFFILNEVDTITACREIIRIFKDQDVYEYQIKKMVCGEMECDEKHTSLWELSSEIRLGYIRDAGEAVYRYSLKAGEVFENTMNERHSDEIFELFEKYCRNNNVGWPADGTRLRSICQLFEAETRRASSGNPLPNAVKISTIHSAKGLEYDIVFVLGLSSGGYPNTSMIDMQYSIRTGNLNTLARSRTIYETLKKEINDASYKEMLNECTNAAFDAHEAKSMAELREELEPIHGYVMSLSADGIHEYIDLYKTYIDPLDEQYRRTISENTKRIAALSAKAETLLNEITLLKQEKNKAFKNRERELTSTKDELAIVEKKRKKLQMREHGFSLSLAALKNHYKTCLIACGLLNDLDKAGEIIKLREKLDVQREMLINEERRLFYVAITRAKDLLYLCYESGGSPSEFINIIDEKLREDYRMLTKEEARELERIRSKLDSAKKGEEILDETLDNGLEELLRSTSFSEQIKEKTATFRRNHPEFQMLSPSVNKYFEKAVGLLFMAEMTGCEYNTEFAHNMQRMGETILCETAGIKAKPVILSDHTLISRIAHDVRNVLSSCQTTMPSPSYFERILLPKEYPGDEMKTLKSAGIMHYIVRSGEYQLDPDITDTWKCGTFASNPQQFLIAVNDLANMRNRLIHPSKNGWEQDPVPTMLDEMKVIIKACSPATTPFRKPTLSENKTIAIPKSINTLKVPKNTVLKQKTANVVHLAPVEGRTSFQPAIPTVTHYAYSPTSFIKTCDANCSDCPREKAGRPCVLFEH